MKKNDKKNESGNKDIVSEIKEEFKRHTNILMEQMRHEVKTVAEGHSILVKKVDEVKSDLSEVKTDLNAVKSDVDKVKSDISELKTDVREIKSEFHSMSMALMETSHETKDHEKRIKKLEERVFV